ncbi:MAG: hypothetical protein N2487_04060 [Verrucomicrobiae bacterium]|nr:hypothetical protein [Verrucomicrobiae bacterium]
MTQFFEDNKIDRKTAWWLLLLNLILPGLGSILAKKKIGIAQILLSSASLSTSFYYLFKFGQWIFINRNDILSGEYPSISPEVASKIWEFLKPMILAAGVFIIALCWSLYTNYSIFRECDKTTPRQM